MNMHASWVKGAALASLVAASASAQVVVYDNSITPLNSFFSSQTEFGDEISIGAGWIAHSFTFEYFGENLSGNEKAVVRFYRNDGVPVGPSQAPGSLFFESTEFSIINGNYPISIIDLAALNIALPSSFTWTVKVTGLTETETFALKLYDPPNPGSSFDDFWRFTADGWELRQAEGLPPGTGSNFGATLTAVPEPGALTLIGVGALALMARRRSSRA
ncbi:MAG: PEP-CTERM sorting domain-containing protein [Verrucomicrobiales bacterium]|nr:PEP-CTERM sorting domain-containing protein [Verrucomicrobiales bacterium]